MINDKFTRKIICVAEPFLKNYYYVTLLEKHSPDSLPATLEPFQTFFFPWMIFFPSAKSNT